ncbi:hypothetical protein MFLAVUS_007050 [Mucor flavus]|uniref:Uncharacterized protein n=1 Tax=Mucor flavus TaxID=439312 RepID=A0ABP9Z3B4_9FUNG
MSGFRISKAAALPGVDALVNATLACPDHTVGPNTYKLFCSTESNPNGACETLPSNLTDAGKIDCLEASSQPYLQSLYDTTGMACVISCTYPRDANGGASMMDPNFTVTFMALFAVMLLCIRRAI